MLAKRKAPNELVEDMDKNMQISNKVLSQFDGGHISFYALNWARMICEAYTPSLHGERIYNYCLTNLPVFIAADDRLQFGWNELCLYRNVQLHNFEYEHLLLSSALTECLSNNYAGAVMSHLGDPYEQGLRTKPCLQHFRELMGSLNGVLAASDFGLMLDDRIRLDPYRAIAGHATTQSNSLLDPTHFARALHALSDMSSGNLQELVLVGGSILAWFATFAELFLDFNVDISARDGARLYNLKTSDDRPTLKLIFTDDLNAEQRFHQEDHQGGRGLTLILLCPPSQKEQAVPRVPFTGRVNFETLLPKVFGNSFHMLTHQESKPFVRAVGGMSRLFQICLENPDIYSTTIAPEHKTNPASYGFGLIQTLCNWFPELRHLQGRFERVQRYDMQETQANCWDAADQFSRFCGCIICSQPPHEDAADRSLPEGFCLLALMETIINLGLALSRVTVTPKLYPSRAGVLCLYQKQVAKLIRAREDWVPGYKRLDTLFIKDWNASDSQRLRDVVALFTGSWPEHDLADNLVAMSHEGVCAYTMTIQRGDSRAPRPEDAGLIRVTSGHIAWQQSNFSRVCFDLPQGVPNDYTWEELKPRHLSKSLWCK